ncbi:hypothetical protein BHM03_00038245 [Ensete ventricosum]|nr:hypothetical protein BHM03_00038245 [Ensete ventricosum]
MTEGRKGRGGLGCGRSDWEEKEVAGSDKGCGNGRAAGSGKEAREECEEGAAGAAIEEGYGRLEAAAVVVEEERRWWPRRGGGD